MTSELAEVLQKSDRIRSYIYRRMMRGVDDGEDRKTLRKLDHHERELQYLVGFPPSLVDRLRFGWHTGWIETHHTIYLLKQEVETEPY